MNTPGDLSPAPDALNPNELAPEIAASEDAVLAAQPPAGEGRLLYWLSVPERAVRSGAGLVSGALRESAAG